MPHSNWTGKPTIGVLAGWQFYRTATNLSYLKPIFTGINRAAQEMGFNLLFGCGMGASAKPEDPLRPAWPQLAPDVDYVPINSQNTDGLIVFSPLHATHRSRYIQELIAVGHPVLFIGSGENGPAVVVDNAGGITAAVEHLVQHGHRQIAFIAGSLDDLNGDSGERLRAYQAATQQFCLSDDPSYIAYGNHFFHGGYQAMREILARAVPFTSVIASNDESALGAMQALKEAGREVPRDVAIIGFDNRIESASQESSLSSIHVPLFSIGYQAGERMIRHLQGQADLAGMYRVATRLVTRESCGCGDRHAYASKHFNGIDAPDTARSEARLAAVIASTILNQAKSLSDHECESLCNKLVAAFNASSAQKDSEIFIAALEQAIQATTIVDDDAHIWQDAITLLKENHAGQGNASPETAIRVEALLDRARLLISEQMQSQHRQQVTARTWTNSRMSLLTAGLQTALDEASIYQILAQHLPEMGISLALVVLFQGEADNPPNKSILINALNPDQFPISFIGAEFPPQGCCGSGAVQLALVPLVDRSGQLGYLVFNTENFDLYGAIVQQLGGAFNTARLYRQATEGRRLAEESNRMKSRFLSTISHELRTPLNLIVGLSGMLIKEDEGGEVPLSDPTRRDIERIHAYSQHLGGLIGDVIDLATSDAGQLRLNYDYVDLGQALRMVSESGSQLAADKGLAWEVILPQTGPWVWGDQTRLRQVALNLINNAIKFTNAGRVRLKVEDRGDLVTVSVSDTGLGIAPDEQQTIFDEFVQSERSVSRGYGGLGLGLAISKRLVELHGGTISVQSSGKEGAGSTFTFALPTVQPPVKTDPGVRQQFAEQRVLVLTTQPETSQRLRDLLIRRGFLVEVVQVSNPAEWHPRLKTFQPDTVVLDISTGSDMGWIALKAIKTDPATKLIPVVFYTAAQQDGALLELDYLTKPIEISELTQALDQYWLLADSSHAIRTILVVDDEPNTLEMHARIAQTHSTSNRVLKAHNGREALELLEQEVVDLILLDLQMPEMDGFAVLEAMRAKESTSRIPVIVITGKSLTETDMARLNQGVTAVLSKGLFSIEETVAHISAALEHKRRLSGEARRLVRTAMAYLHEHYAESIARRDIAQHIGITEDHLTFCFRQELGTTPIEYLQRYRINQAKSLLKESQQTITQIALSVGFSDSGYFSRIFRRETGMSPEAFRRS